jgi:hypothetical protein
MASFLLSYPERDRRHVGNTVLRSLEPVKLVSAASIIAMNAMIQVLVVWLCDQLLAT